MDEEEKLNELRKLLGPALPLFRTAVAARRATGATDEDIEAMLAEIEAEMRSLETMDAGQISDMMKIYREEQEAAASPPEGPDTVRYVSRLFVNANSRGRLRSITGPATNRHALQHLVVPLRARRFRLSEEDLRALHVMRRG